MPKFFGVSTKSGEGQIERDAFWFVTGAGVNAILIKIFFLLGWIR